MLFLQLKLGIPYDRAKCIQLPEILPWNRNHPLEIQSASSTTITSADPSTTRILTVTDGSIRKNGAGYSALICLTSELKHSLSGSLPRHNTLFQAEGLAILATLDWIVSTRPLPSQNYEISSDSKSALAASTPSASTKSSQQPLHTAQKYFFFIPSHSGHPGNDMATLLLKVPPNAGPFITHPCR
jgi:ribonuclease HI